MANHPRVRTAMILAVGMLLGTAVGPSLARAYDRLEVNWPNSFRIEWPYGSNLKVEAASAIPVKLDPYSPFPELKVRQVEPQPVAVRPDSLVPGVATLYSTATATVFVVTRPGGWCQVMSIDHATGAVTRLAQAYAW